MRSPRRAAAAPPQALLLRHSKIAAVVRGEWSPQPRVTQSHSIFNCNDKQYILIRILIQKVSTKLSGSQSLFQAL